ncbi:dodecin family protein [Ruania halotolerans]|uniref:dodecin family protein n=1 Tax=Ruania halotolerans TaxID=2897773 RepID=UPI001E5BC12B|nr:dodecin family protein [Ruania halotolerans]UFU06085.1 dodecin family protein [Ruania halotolerans]
MSASVGRITTVSARSDVSFEDAVNAGVARAAATLRHVSGAWVKEQKVEVTDGKITAYQVVLEVTFVLED